MKRTELIQGVEKSLLMLDLLLCSIWGLFMFSSWSFDVRALMIPVLLIIVRLWVSFMVYKRMGYGLYVAIGFAILLIG